MKMHLKKIAVLIEAFTNTSAITFFTVFLVKFLMSINIHCPCSRRRSLRKVS